MASSPPLPPTLLPALLDLLPSGVVYYTPRHDAAGAVVDFDFAYLNASAQQQLDLPAQPATTYLQTWPGSVESGAWAFHRDTFLTGGPARLEQFYQADGRDMQVLAHARRVEQGLLVTFADLSQQPRTVVEQTLRQIREQAARAEAEHQRGELQRLFEQAPVAIAIFRGPQHVIELVNDLHLALWGRSREQVLDRPLFEAIPEAAGIGYEELLAGVLTTGTPYIAKELSARLLRHGVAEEVFFDFVYQPLREADGQISGVVVVATDITEQVAARQRVEQLNHELEDRVQERTQQLYQQQLLLRTVFEQSPAGIFVVRGADYVVELLNPYMSRLLGHLPTQVLGRPYFEVMPELVDQGVPELLRQAWESGEPIKIAEFPAQLAYYAPGRVGYFTFVFQPLRNAQQVVDRIACIALEVTDQVLARQ